MMIEGESTDLNSTSTHNNGRVIIDHNHPLHLLPNNTPVRSLISLQLTRSDDYALWSRSMALDLLGKSKLGFVDGKYTKDKFDESMHDQWEKVNVMVLSWLMNADFSTDKVKGIGKKDQGLYILQNKFVVQNSSLSPVKHAHFVEQVSDSSFLWHRILGHAPSEVIRKHTSLSNLKYIKHLCTVCPLAKHTK
ncbi:hypothetical protein AABB24_028846 [Solanum stoloniferum]|uniref:GAG-pre-integrase domain-containing protein n=1 Tax=Solanum stoloniferum TaxID=62892 RepID=A0ABD2S911_9SOLN